MGIGRHFVPCLPSGTGSETFFRLRAAGYRATWGRGVWAVSQDLEGWCEV